MNKATETKAPPFDWADPFLLHEQLSDEERLIQETAHAFAEDRLRPRDRRGVRPREDGPRHLQ